VFAKYDAEGNVKSEQEFEAAAVLRFGADKRPGGGPFGIDIALVMLAKPVPASVAAPIPVRGKTLGEADVGQTFVEVGYGQTVAQDPRPSFDQTRQKGEVKLNAVSGRPFEKMFKTKEAFEAYLTKVEDAAFASDRGAEIFAQELSAYGQEVHAGGEIGGPQGCFGDSGGPLLQKKGAGYELVAVVSNGPEGRKNGCIAGEMFARAGEEVIEAVKARASRPDPWTLVSCSTSPTPLSACASSDELRACGVFSTALGGSLLKQRIERCASRELACKASSSGAACQ